MKRTVLLAITAAAALMADSADQRTQADARLRESATVFQEIMGAPDKGIPSDLLEGAHCAVIVPAMKQGAFIVGGKYGKGFMTCRIGRGWSAPGAVRVEGGSFGFQIGGSETDVVMLVMNQRGADRLLSSKFTLGAEGTVAAGPVGRTATAQTDAKMTAEILSWSRSRGVFAGVALSGATLREDLDDNASLYGSKLSNRSIVDSKRAATASARPLLNILERYSPHERK